MLETTQDSISRIGSVVTAFPMNRRDNAAEGFGSRHPVVDSRTELMMHPGSYWSEIGRFSTLAGFVSMVLGFGCRASQPVIFSASQPSPTIVHRQKTAELSAIAKPTPERVTETTSHAPPIQQVSFATSHGGLAELIAMAISRNPEVEAARKELEMASAKIPQVASLADPMVDFVTWPIFPNVEQQVGGRMIADVGISQEVPWAGKRESRVGQASGEVSRLQSKLIAIELQVANEVKQAFADLWLATRKLEIAKDDHRFLEGLSELAETRYATGNGGQQDILRVKSELGLNQAEQSRMIADQKMAKAELARVLSNSAENSSTTPFDPSALESIGLPEWLPEPPLPKWDDVSAQALAANPELHARWAEVQRDQWRVKESRLNYYPDLTYSAGWGAMTTNRAMSPVADGIDNLTAGVSFNLPVRRAARDAALQESESQVEKGISEWQQQRDKITRDLQQIYSILESLESQLEQYRNTILPSLEQALEISTTAYEANQVTMSELIELRRELLKLRSQERELQAQRQKRRADLSWLMAEMDWQ